MIDIKKIRKDPEKLKIQMMNRGENFKLTDIDDVSKYDNLKRKLLIDCEALKNNKNEKSLQISKLVKEHKDVIYERDEIKKLSNKIKEYDAKIQEVEKNINEIMISIPNIPHESVPQGVNYEDNIEIRRWGKPREFNFEPKAHWELGVDNEILEFERASKISGPRFTIYKGLGARLERSLINYFLDKHIYDNGYSEIFCPYIVNDKSMFGTGQLPKFEESLFKIKDTNYYLIPTSEVSVTNIHSDEILDGNKLPLKYVSYSACFRDESSSAGRDNRGLIRQHQFNKIELVKISKPDNSYDELEKLVKDVEMVLQELNLPYRVIKICTGDLGFAAALKYDIEVWMPSYNRYVEISSCSNFEDFQARRANIKYKENDKSKPQYVHTINGSGLAVGRTVAAVLENYQNQDESIEVPKVLIDYMRADIIKK